MFHGMGHAGHILFVAEVSDIDVKGGAGLVCLWIVDQQGLKLVGQANHTVGSVVERRGLELIRHPLDRLRPRLAKGAIQVPGTAGTGLSVRHVGGVVPKPSRVNDGDGGRCSGQGAGCRINIFGTDPRAVVAVDAVGWKGVYGTGLQQDGLGDCCLSPGTLEEDKSSGRGVGERHF